MYRAACLIALLMVAQQARAADFQPLAITTSPPWLQKIESQGGGSGGPSLEAPPGQQPARLSGVLTAGSFSAYADAFISAAGDSISIDLSGVATSYSSQAGDSLKIEAAPIDVTIPIPQSAQSVVQIFADWSLLTTAPGWAVNGGFYCSGGNSQNLGVQGLGVPAGLATMNAQRYEPPPTGGFPSPVVGVLTVPSGEVLFGQCFLQFAVSATGRQTGPFHMNGNVRFRIAQPLALGDVNANGVADLADVAILRRRLAGEPVNLP